MPAHPRRHDRIFRLIENEGQSQWNQFGGAIEQFTHSTERDKTEDVVLGAQGSHPGNTAAKGRTQSEKA